MTSAQPPLHNQQPLPRWITAAVIGLTLLVSTFAMSPNVADPDLWGHVQFGRDVIASRSIPETNTYSFTAENFRWINHENLSEIVMAVTVDTLGNAGLLWGKFALSLLVIGTILAFQLRQGIALIPACLLSILVAWNLGYHWSFRPQLSSFVFFTLLVLTLQIAFRGWRGHWGLAGWRPRWATRNDEALPDIDPGQLRWLWFCPVIFLLWTNSHGGYVAGICILLAYLGLRGLEALGRGRELRWPVMSRLALVGLACLLATLINPYSWRLPVWLLESLGEPRPEILDWSQAPLWGLVGWKFWALVAVTLTSLVASRRSLDLTQILLLAITLWQACTHFRHVPFFAILAGFWIGPHLQSALARFQQESHSSSLTESRAVRWAAGILVAVVIGSVGFRLADRLGHLRVERDVFPVDAFEFMASRELGGRMVVTYDWAQYAIHALTVDENRPPGQPASRVAFDGRFRTCYPQQLVDMHFDLLFGNHTSRHRSPDSPPVDPTRVLDYGSPDLVLVRRRGEWSCQVMAGQTDQWVLLYEDPLAQLWGRRSRYDAPDSSEYLPPALRVVTEEPLTGFVEWPALPAPKSVQNSTTPKQETAHATYTPLP